jgi:hypothetical protein
VQSLQLTKAPPSTLVHVADLPAIKRELVAQRLRNEFLQRLATFGCGRLRFPENLIGSSSVVFKQPYLP